MVASRLRRACWTCCHTCYMTSPPTSPTSTWLTICEYLLSTHLELAVVICCKNAIISSMAASESQHVCLFCRGSTISDNAVKNTTSFTGFGGEVQNLAITSEHVVVPMSDLTSLALAQAILLIHVLRLLIDQSGVCFDKGSSNQCISAFAGGSMTSNT